MPGYLASTFSRYSLTRLRGVSSGLPQVAALCPGSPHVRQVYCFRGALLHVRMLCPVSPHRAHRRTPVPAARRKRSSAFFLEGSPTATFNRRARNASAKAWGYCCIAAASFSWSTIHHLICALALYYTGRVLNRPPFLGFFSTSGLCWASLTGLLVRREVYRASGVSLAPHGAEELWGGVVVDVHPTADQTGTLMLRHGSPLRIATARPLS